MRANFFFGAASAPPVLRLVLWQIRARTDAEVVAGLQVALSVVFSLAAKIETLDEE